MINQWSGREIECDDPNTSNSTISTDDVQICSTGEKVLEDLDIDEVDTALKI